MSTKKNRAKKLPEATRKLRWPWSQLPPNLNQSQRYFHFTPSQGTTKSWLTTSSRCNSTPQHGQWRVLHHLVNKDSSATMPHNRYFRDDRSIDALSQGPNTSYWCVLKADTARVSHPPVYHGPRQCRVLSSGLEHPVVVAYVGDLLLENIPTSTLAVFYSFRRDRNYYQYKCIRHECFTIDPFDAKKKYLEFTSMVRCEGKVYAMSLQGTLVVMEIVDLRLRITNMSARRAVPYESSRLFTEYLLEMNGDIILVFLIHQNSVEIVDQVEVFRLCFVKLEWIKVEMLQGKTLVLGPLCFWANSAEIGCKGDCVYFRHGSCEWSSRKPLGKTTWRDPRARKHSDHTSRSSIAARLTNRPRLPKQPGPQQSVPPTARLHDSLFQ